MDFVPNEVFWSRRRFQEAKKLLPTVRRTMITDKRRYYRVGLEEVILDNTSMSFSCTCTEGTLHQHKGTLCSHVLAVITFEVMRC